MKFQNGYTTQNVKRSTIQSTENNDCVVRAISNVTNCDYDKAHGLVAKHYNRRNNRGTSTIAIINHSVDLFNDLGFNYEEVNQVYAKSTINQFVRRNPRGRFLILVRSHALAIVNGVVYDNADRTSGRHKINFAFKIEERAKRTGRTTFTITHTGTTHTNLTPKQVHAIVGGNLASVQSICAKRRPTVYGWKLIVE